MSPRPRRRLWPTRPAALVIGLLSLGFVASGCGSSSGPSAGGVSSTVRSEPVTGRDDPAPSTTAAVPTETTGATALSTAAADPRTGNGNGTGIGVGGDRLGVRTGAQVLVDGGLQPLLGRRVGLIANRASVVDDERLIDVLARHPEVDLVALFAPEHGVEAADAAGATVLDGVDTATGLPVQSLYDEDRAPDPEVLAGLDILVFDLQDAGTRFYTYVSTLGLAMQAAADADVPMLVLDRPNPLGGDRPDGARLLDDQRSFVGLYPIPALPGLTIGELALAIEGEGWLDGLDGLELDVVALEGWNRSARWPDTGLPWNAPSPGLPSAELALLYPATVLLEATTVSFGRGTDRPFGQFGAPWLDAAALVERLERAELGGITFQSTRFTDETGAAVAGVRIEVTDPASVRPFATGVHIVHHLLTVAEDRVVIDRPDFFDLLAGTGSLRRDLVAGVDPADIIEAWSADLAIWEATRAPYLRYPDSDG